MIQALQNGEENVLMWRKEKKTSNIFFIFSWRCTFLLPPFLLGELLAQLIGVLCVLTITCTIFLYDTNDNKRVFCNITNTVCQMYLKHRKLRHFTPLLIATLPFSEDTLVGILQSIVLLHLAKKAVNQGKLINLNFICVGTCLLPQCLSALLCKILVDACLYFFCNTCGLTMCR